MEPSQVRNQAVQEELDRRQASTEAAVIETQGLVKAGWVCLIVSWVAPILPFLGFLVTWVGVLVSFILSIVVLVKGNIKSGVILLVSSIFGTGLIILVWSIIYAGSIFSASSM